MRCAISGLERTRHDEVVVVIDVIRAFTTAAAALAAGAGRILCVESLERARSLVAETPGARSMGERHGRRPEGFDFGNSPLQFDGIDLGGRPVVLTTTNGTRGLLWAEAPTLFAAAAVTAGATARAAASAGTDVRLVCTDVDMPEDRACAGHLAALLRGEPAPPERLRAGVLAAGAAHRARWTRPPTDEDHVDFDRQLAACAAVDRYDFTLAGRRLGDVVELTPV
jgi:2-phosphosulfolactate phosphatase